MSNTPEPSLTPAQEARLRDALREANNLAFGYANALIVAAPPSVGGELHHGSGIILHIPEGHFLLTAEHVVRSWYARYPREPAVMLHLRSPDGWRQFKAIDRLVLYDQSADIAALRLTADEAAETGTFIYEPATWPPPAPVIGEMVHIAGFPKDGRIQLGPKKYEFRSMNLGVPVTHIAEPNFKCQLDRSQWADLSKEVIGAHEQLNGSGRRGCGVASDGPDWQQ